MTSTPEDYFSCGGTCGGIEATILPQGIVPEPGIVITTSYEGETVISPENAIRLAEWLLRAAGGLLKQKTE